MALTGWHFAIDCPSAASGPELVMSGTAASTLFFRIGCDGRRHNQAADREGLRVYRHGNGERPLLPHVEPGRGALRGPAGRTAGVVHGRTRAQGTARGERQAGLTADIPMHGAEAGGSRWLLLFREVAPRGLAAYKSGHFADRLHALLNEVLRRAALVEDPGVFDVDAGILVESGEHLLEPHGAFDRVLAVAVGAADDLPGPHAAAS